MKFKLFLGLNFLFCFSFYAQLVTTVKGEVFDKKDNSTVNTAVITILSSSRNVTVNNEGEFVLESWQSPPLDIKISSIGYKDYYYTVTSNEEWITVLLEEEVTGLDEITIAASRAPEQVFESPVSVEILTTTAIENTTSSTFYEGLENLKGVNVNTSSFGFKSINTRGFASFGNTRFVQLVDGMDNVSPGLNFAVGNLVGLNDLDVKSVELLPGASSALYGANAFNGIMFLNSKNPFVYEGTSAYGKIGFTNAENIGLNEYVDVGVRVAKKINDKVALKFTASYLNATDWLGSDDRNLDREGRIKEGNRDANQAYNGVNIYGDEISRRINGEDVTRTGYAESDLVDAGTNSFKTSFSAHFRPSKYNKDNEIIYSSKFGTGSTTYQETNRVALKNFIMHQHKIELNTKYLVARLYATIEDAGDSYDIGFVGQNILNESSDLWYAKYEQELAATNNIVKARTAADNAYRIDENSVEFRRLFNQVVDNSDLTKGAKFVDASKIYEADLNYNFKEKISFAEVQIGGSARRNALKSEGTVFTDKNDAISYYNFGLYTQLQKSLLEDRLKLTASVRYDKADNFSGNFSPRASAIYVLDNAKKHNIRASFQTGFRNPTSQQQYVGVNTVRAVVLGSAPGNGRRYNTTIRGFDFNGQQAFDNAFTAQSALAFSGAVEESVKGGLSLEQAAGVHAGLLKKATVNNVKPEEVRSYEMGYRGRIFKDTELNVNGYYNQYKNFLATQFTVVPLYGSVDLASDGFKALEALASDDFTRAAIYTNSNVDVTSYGFDLGLTTKIFKAYKLGISYALAKQDFDVSEDSRFESAFNTPEHRVKVSLGNSNIFKGIGFGVDARWQDAFLWQSNYVDGVVSARTVVDAQLSYQIEKLKSRIKIGGINLLGKEYVSAPGASTVGSQAYISWTSNF